MGIVLIILYIAIALWVYSLLSLRGMYRTVLSRQPLSAAPARARKRFKKLVLALAAASVLILICVVVIIVININNNNL